MSKSAETFDPRINSRILYCYVRNENERSRLENDDEYESESSIHVPVGPIKHAENGIDVLFQTSTHIVTHGPL